MKKGKQTDTINWQPTLSSNVDCQLPFFSPLKKQFLRGILRRVKIRSLLRFLMGFPIRETCNLILTINEKSCKQSITGKNESLLQAFIPHLVLIPLLFMKQYRKILTKSNLKKERFSDKYDL